jgi:hypothetical protein
MEEQLSKTCATLIEDINENDVKCGTLKVIWQKVWVQLGTSKQSWPALKIQIEELFTTQHGDLLVGMLTLQMIKVGVLPSENEQNCVIKG